MRLTLLVAALSILAGSVLALGMNVSLAGACNYNLQNSNTNYFINGTACSAANVSFAGSVSNSSLYCSPGTTFGSGSSFSFLGGNDNDSTHSCSFNGTQFNTYSNVKADIIGPSSANIVPRFLGQNSNITVGYYLNISVFEPYGYNSAAMFGDRVAAFAWILPLLNNTINVHDTELQMSEFYNNTFYNGTYKELISTVPFGTYGGYNGLDGTQIFLGNEHNYSYGRVIGSRRYPVAAYTIYDNRTVNYNPYEIDYSFFAFDQLVMFKLNITSNYNLMPVYIQPINPGFNFYILPDNGTDNFTIKWLVAVPPQDHGWNFSAYIYRYRYDEFTVNPELGIGNHSSFVDMLNYPSSGYQRYVNGTEYYFLNYTSRLGLGLNSSIVTAPGTIPGIGSFIQDSTTPSFGLGLGFCSSYYNESAQAGSMVVNYSGTYDMVNRLEPIFQPGIPGLVSNASCGIGITVRGKDITINCRGGVINDTAYGAVILDSKNVTLENCNVYGNGIAISNSSNVTLSNTRFYHNGYSVFAVNVSGSSLVKAYNTTLEQGFADPILVGNSAGVAFSGIDACTQFNATALQGRANLTGLSYFCNASQQPTLPSGNATPKQGKLGGVTGKDLLYVGALIVAVIYIYLFFRFQYKPGKAGSGRKRGR